MKARPQFAACMLMAAIAWAPSAAIAQTADFMFRATVDGRELEGQPLKWTADNMYLLGRDGQLFEFDPREATNGQMTGSHFVPYTMQEMKRELYREFRDSLDISTTQHYIVVHPRGQQREWANRFEELYRWCIGYFRVRGFTPREPPYPLIAIVYPSQAEYYRAAAARGKPLPPGVLGNYDNQTNRVYLYDDGNEPLTDSSENAATVIHEATHQTAFNVGIHSRFEDFTDQPRWLIEGLATMFEARGVWNSLSFHTLKDRVNRGRLDDFHAIAASRPKGLLTALIASDRVFQINMGGAYAEAWALSFFLCETRPRQYVAYLEKVASRPMYTRYSARQRVADFQAVFGSDLETLEANYLAWMKNIK